LLIATVVPTEYPPFADQLAQLPAQLPADFQTFAQRALSQTRRLQSISNAPVFTDDHAPVEQVVHRIIWDFMVGR